MVRTLAKQLRRSSTARLGNRQCRVTVVVGQIGTRGPTSAHVHRTILGPLDRAHPSVDLDRRAPPTYILVMRNLIIVALLHVEGLHVSALSARINLSTLR